MVRARCDADAQMVLNRYGDEKGASVGLDMFDAFVDEDS